MSLRKFGISPDQKVLADDKDAQGVRKEASRKPLTEEKREALQRENESK